MAINENIYLPLLQEFVSNTKEVYEKGYPHGVFIPYAFERYLNSSPRIFYIGQDTRGWMGDKEHNGNYWLLKYYRENNLAYYLHHNQSTVTPQKLFQWNKDGSAGVFWDVVQKLHLYIKTGSDRHNLSKMSDPEKNIIEEIGYGNMNAIELISSLRQEHLWHMVDEHAYKIVVKAGQNISLIRHILDAYSPDYLIIFNWTNNLKPFTGLERNNYDHLYVDTNNSKMCVAEINGTETKIIWTAHPSWFHRKGYSDKNIVDLVVNAYREIGGVIG